MNRFYRTVVTLFAPLIKFLFHIEAKGLEHVAEGKGLVLCPNHSSGWDPIVLCAVLPPTFRMRLMAKKELMENPFLRLLIEKLGGFGVDRGGADLAAVKLSIKTLKDGDNLLVFPEGTRVEKEGDERAKGGVVMIAMRAEAKLVPVSLGGKKRLFHKTRIVFGEPYVPEVASRRPTAEELQSCADEVLRRAYALGREEVR